MFRWDKQNGIMLSSLWLTSFLSPSPFPPNKNTTQQASLEPTRSSQKHSMPSTAWNTVEPAEETMNLEMEQES